MRVVIHFPLWPERPFCLPILFRLYLNKKRAAEERRAYRSKPELAVEMLRILCKHRANRRFHALVDSAYGGQSVLAHLPANCDLTSRLRLDCTMLPHCRRKARRAGHANGARNFRRLRRCWRIAPVVSNFASTDDMHWLG